jgi:hypothetical protein
METLTNNVTSRDVEPSFDPAPPPPKRRRLWRTIIITTILLGLFVLIVPNFLLCGGFASRGAAQRILCVNNLRQIETAKEQWALQTAADPKSPVDVETINALIPNALRPCRKGGTYTYGNLGQPPTCSIKNHTLSPRK